jgi:hypothetical protein
VAAFLFVSSLAQAQTSIISQIVDGAAWLTAIAVTNKSTSVVPAGLSFFQETTGAAVGATQPWNLNFVEMTSAQAQILVLQPDSTIFLHTLGAAPNLTVGWGQLQELDGAGSVVAYAIFTQRVPGRTDQAGTSPATAAVSRILVPIDNANGAVTSMAIANATTSSESISVAIRTAVSTTQEAAITLPSQGHTAFTFPAQFPDSAGQSGLAEFYTTSGTFSILALRFQNGAFTTAVVYSANGPPIIVSANGGGGGGGGIPPGNINAAFFTLAKVNSANGSFPTTGPVTDLIGGQIQSYTPAEWQYPFNSGQTFDKCTTVDVTYPTSGKAPYTPDSFLDAGTINVSGPNVPQGATLRKLVTPTGPVYSYLPGAGAPLQLGVAYTIGTNGGSQVGPFTKSATLPSSFTVTNWDQITSISRANGLTVMWTGAGFADVDILINGTNLTATTVHSVSISCIVDASLGTYTIPLGALAMLPVVQAGNLNDIGQLSVSTLTSVPAGVTVTAVSATVQDLVPPLVGGGQANYGTFGPALTVLKSLSIQ